jgi:hypothetical protein
MRNNTTQEFRVLEVLQKANGEWVNGNYFRLTMMLSQYHRAIHNLQNKRDKYSYVGNIEASPFTDEHGFKSYRLVAPALPQPVQPRRELTNEERGRVDALFYRN